MANDLESSFTASFRKGGRKAPGVGGVAIEQVEDTKCDDIEIDVYVGSRAGTWDVHSTVGSASFSGTKIKEVVEVVTINNSDSATLGNPAVTSFNSATRIGQSFIVIKGGAVIAGSTTIVYDDETNSIRSLNGTKMFAVFEVSYTVEAKRHSFSWGGSEDIKESVVFVTSDSGSASITLSRRGCEPEGFVPYQEDQKSVYDLSIDVLFAVADTKGATKDIKEGTLVSTAIIADVYPYPSTVSPEFVFMIGTKQIKIENARILETHPELPISELINFNGRGVGVLSHIPNAGTKGGAGELSLTAIGSFYTESAEVLTNPIFAKPETKVFEPEPEKDETKPGHEIKTAEDLERERKEKESRAFMLGPTEIGCIDGNSTLLTVLGTCRADYTIPMNTVLFNVQVPFARKLATEWNGKIMGAVVVHANNSFKRILYKGEGSVINPFDRNQAAKDKREQDLLDRVFKD